MVPVITSITVIVLALIVSAGIRYMARRSERIADKEAGRPVNGDLTAQQEKILVAENDTAAEIFRRILAPADSLGEMNILTTKERADATKWLARYMNRKKI